MTVFLYIIIAICIYAEIKCYRVLVSIGNIVL